MRWFTFFRKGLLHRLNLRIAFLVCGLGLALCAPLPADEGGPIEEMKVAPCADTFISSRKHADERKKNFGLKKELKVVRGKRDGWGRFRDWKGALIRFDLAAIPNGAEIQEARIFLYHENHEGELLSLHRMEREWAETGASWFESCGGCEPWWNGWDNGNYGNYGKDATDTQRVRKNDHYFLGCPRWPACEGRSQPIYLEYMVGKDAASAYFEWERGEKARAGRLKQERTKGGQRGLKLNLRPSSDDAVFKSVVEGCIKSDLLRSRKAFSRMYRGLWVGENDETFAANC